MPNPASSLQNLSQIVEQPAVEDGYISTVHPAPASFGEPVYVIVPSHSTSVPLGPCEWGALHGTALPAQGARCQVAFGGLEVPRIIWWEGTPAGIASSRETLAIAGAVSAEEFPGFFVDIGAGETLHLTEARFQLLGGTSVNVEVRKNKAPVAGYEALAVSKTAGSTSSSKSLANGDYINWKTSSPSGSPKGLSVTLFLK